jgi:hypothetical protein
MTCGSADIPAAGNARSSAFLKDEIAAIIQAVFVFRKPSPMAMVSQEGNSNTPCFLLPPFQGEIKPPAMRVVVD